MTTEIVIDPTLQQYIIKVNDIEIDRASTYAQADDILSAYMRRFGNPDIALLNSAIGALDAVDRALTVELAHLDDSPQCPCGMPALFFVQYPGKTYAYCPDCYRELNAGRPPLLAQCAAIIRRCLGSTTGAGSIIDELRRVDRALRAEGW